MYVPVFMPRVQHSCRCCRRSLTETGRAKRPWFAKHAGTMSSRNPGSCHRCRHTACTPTAFAVSPACSFGLLQFFIVAFYPRDEKAPGSDFPIETEQDR